MELPLKRSVMNVKRLFTNVSILVLMELPLKDTCDIENANPFLFQSLF